MGEIVNLRSRRKQRVRTEKERRAAENRAKFGLSKAAKSRIGREREQTCRNVDGAKLDPSDTDKPDAD